MSEAPAESSPAPSDSAPAGANGATPPAEAAPAGGAEASDWREALPEDLRGSPHIQNYTSLEDLAKGHVNAQNTISRSIRIPGQDAGDDAREAFISKLTEVDGVVRVPTADQTPEEIGQFWNRLGRPETHAGYELQAPEFEGLKFEGGEAESFWKQTFHGLGLTQEQAQGVFSAYLKNQGEVMSGALKETAAAETALREEWGDAYEQRIQIANQAVQQVMPEGYAELCEQMGLGRNPLHIRAMEKIGRMALEDEVLRDITPSGQMTAGVEEMREQISELKANPAYTSGSHPDHKRIVEKVNSYYERIEAMRRGANA